MKLNLPKYKWELPKDLEVPRDELVARLDIYHESIVLYLMEKGTVTTRIISADNLATALLRHVTLGSGILPEGSLWWRIGRNGPEVALWRPPKVWKVALQEEAFKPARRFDLPMPGLIFMCSPGRPPSVFAVKSKPKLPSTPIYHAPLFNTYDNGTTCPGTNKYPAEISEIPENFFTCFFTKTTWGKDRSKKHGRDLLALWEEIDGKPSFPKGDLVRAGTITDLSGGGDS